MAEFKDGKMTVWASTQTPFPTRDRVAGRSSSSPSKVRVVTPYVGGGFGGKSAEPPGARSGPARPDHGQAGAGRLDAPEEFFYDPFDPAAVVEIVSGLDKARKISSGTSRVHAAGARGATLFYDIPNVRVRTHGQPSYGAEAPGQSMHLFAVGPVAGAGRQHERLRDGIADRPHGGGRRRRSAGLPAPASDGPAHAPGPPGGRRGVRLEGGAAPSGRGRGVACSIDAGTYVAPIAEVRVDAESRQVTVERVVCAQDMGIVVNPDGAKMQMEGAITMGLGYTLTEELRFRGGDILDRNFESYDIPRFSWVPPIETVLVKNDELAPQGGGEPAITRPAP